MNRVRTTPKNDEHWHRLRQADLTSTQTAALFALSSYLTTYELYHVKRDPSMDQFKPTERTVWGQRMEEVIAHAVAEEKGWKIRKMNEYITLPGHRAGSSYDYRVLNENTILEVKNVDGLIFRNNWKKKSAGVYDAPPHIEIQVQHQLWVSGMDKAVIAALVGGNHLVLIERVRNEEMIKDIQEATAEFWAMVDANEEPVPDYERDADFIAKLYRDCDPGLIFHGEDDEKLKEFADNYERNRLLVKSAGLQQGAAKAMILEHITTSEKAFGDGFVVNAGTVHKKNGTSYRGFGITWPKKEEE